MIPWKRLVATAVVVAAAAGVVGVKYRDYVLNPWTRNGQVRAQVIQVAPRVSGPIVDPAGNETVEALRARLDARVQALELRVGEVLDRAPAVDAGRSDPELYRALGALRGLSESVVGFVAAAQPLDWARWREVRF